MTTGNEVDVDVADGIAFQVLVGDFVEVAGGDEAAFLEEGVVHHSAMVENPVVEFLD